MAIAIVTTYNMRLGKEIGVRVVTGLPKAMGGMEVNTGLYSIR